MEEDRMSNITLKILDLTGDTVLADLDADTVRAEVNALDGERWVFVDGLSLIHISEPTRPY